tara:strand:+ start:547 stop:1137 length:591 start_codon:yes stop_codon:yes gene_type:complete
VKTPWTQLAGTDLWEQARSRHDADSWRSYHAFDHPVYLYTKAEALGYRYCASLDAAILTHDVIVSGQTPEQASWEWLKAHQAQPDMVSKRLIMSTVDHLPGADNRLIILDLSGFLHDDVRRANTEALRVEKERQSGWDRETFDLKTLGYLTGLEGRIAQGLDLPVVSPDDGEVLGEIRSGILKTIDELGRCPVPGI